jgi:hypothetical protein
MYNSAGDSLELYLFNALSDWNDAGDEVFTQRQMAELAEHFADVAGMIN